MSPYQRNVIVGAVVLVGLGMLAWMILQFANKAATYFLSSGTKITLLAERAEGVGDGSPVTYRGVAVGRVTGVRLNDAGDGVIIDALIERAGELPADVRARIRQTSLLGASSTIALEPDPVTETRPSQSSGKRLAAGMSIRAEYASGITDLGDNIRGLTDSMEQTIHSINNVIGDSKVQDDIKVSLTNARETMENANRISARIEKLTEQLDTIAKDTQGTMSSVRDTVKDGRTEMLKLSSNLNQRIDQLADSLQRVQSVARKIDEGKGTAGALVNDSKLYESLADTASELNLMIKDMRRLIQQWEQEGIIKL